MTPRDSDTEGAKALEGLSPFLTDAKPFSWGDIDWSPKADHFDIDDVELDSIEAEGAETEKAAEEMRRRLAGYDELLEEALTLRRLALRFRQMVGAAELGLPDTQDARLYKLEAVATSARLVVRSAHDAGHDERDLRERIRLLALAVLELDR